MSVYRNIPLTLPRAYVLVALLFVIAATLSARTTVTVQDSIYTYYNLDKSKLDSVYRNNVARIDSTIAAFSAIAPARISGLSVIGSASPEGNPRHNLKLSSERAATLINFIFHNEVLPDSLLSVTAIGGDFAGLRKMVANDTAMPGRSEALTVLDGPDDGNIIARLKGIGDGSTYRYISRNMFPDLRKATLVVDYSLPSPTEIEAEMQLMPTSIIDTTGMTLLPVLTIPKWHKPRYMALKTNMLYDLAAIPNISFEYYVGRNWSVSAEWLGAWWSQNDRHRYWRVYGGDITVRRWFGHAADEKPLTGHHVGAFVGAVTFDFEWDGDGYMGGLPHGTIFDRCMMAGGVEYGYSMPVAKRLNIDFTIGVGYFGGKYIKYSPKDGHYFKDSEMKLNYFGPTKLEVSLVWLIGQGNSNH